MWMLAVFWIAGQVEGANLPAVSLQGGFAGEAACRAAGAAVVRGMSDLAGGEWAPVIRYDCLRQD